MRLCTLRLGGVETAAVVTDQGVVPVARINSYLGRAWSTDLLTLLQQGLTLNLLRDAERTSDALPPESVNYAPLYRHPRKIWGIGLNYKDHADHTIIGPGDAIELPPESERVTAEAELGVIIGRECRRVAEEDVPHYIAGYCLIIDMTAEDILQRNPRFLTRSKNFDTFFSFGPELITPDEVLDIMRLRVGTWKNGTQHRENVVANMAFPPHYLVAFHSNVMTLYPGDIISTGTPGAVVIEPGDIAECRVEGLGSLLNPVRRRIGIGFSALASAGV
jgi:2-keto-4-pentenoate hydratase/2-oxohepta-3-ene-1,7-dioic acid hydratase in catechol pathway